MRILLIILAIFSFWGKCFSTNYYVRTDGSNSNTGTTNTSGGAWLTLEYASTHVSSGDLINMGVGTFIVTTQVVLPIGVSIVGQGASTTIKSTLSGAYQEIINMRSVSEGTNGNQSISYIKFDGDNLTTSWGICVAARSNVSIHHCEFISFKETAVNFSGINDPLGPGIIPPTIYATGNTFHDNVVYNCSSNSAVTILETKYGKGCFQYGGQQGMLIYNNDIQQPQRSSPVNNDIGWPIKMANRGHTKGCKVYNNVLKRAPMAAPNGQDQNWNFCFELWYIEGGMEFYNNTCQGEVDIANTYLGEYSFGIKFYGNTFLQPALNAYSPIGIRLETDEYGISIYNNTFYNLTTAVAFSPFDYDNDGIGINVKNVDIHSNLMYNMGKIGGGDKVIQMDNTAINPQCYFDSFYFDNNTVIAAAGGNAPFFGIEAPNYAGGNTKKIYIRNNHFQGFSLNPVLIGNGSHVDSIYIQNNNYYGNGSNSVNIFSGGTPSHYFNSGDISVAPDFDVDYRPNAGSPLIGAGLNLGYGDDIGALQYGADIPPTVTSVSPTDGATGVSISVTPQIIFSEPLDPTTVTTSTCYISGVTSTVSYSTGTVTITPVSPLAYSTSYTVTITTGIKDIGGNNMVSPYGFSFTTQSSPVPPSSGTMIIKASKFVFY